MQSPKRARVPYVSHPQTVIAPTAEYPRRGTIGKLSDEVLLNIFRYYLDGSPRLWPRLVHISRKWRRIVFASQQALRLRLFCTHGTHVPKSLDFWPALPIVVEYGGSPELNPPAPEDEDNIMAALKHSGRVTSISLTVTVPLLDKLSAIKTPFWELEDLVLLSRQSLRVTLPSAFWWATKLRSLRLINIAFFALPQLLHSSRNLVNLHLHEVLNPWFFSPKVLTDALSGMAELRSLSLHLISTDYYIELPLPSDERIVLPSLAYLEFRGTSGYLEDIVARIDAPLLGDIEVTFFKEPLFDLSQLREFINRIEIHKSHRQAHILFSGTDITISFVQPGVPACMKLKLLSKKLDEQLSYMHLVRSRFSAFIEDVEDLRISATRQPKWDDIYHREDWLTSLIFFTGVKWLHLDETIERSTLPLASTREYVLPTMHKLYIPQPGPRHAPLGEAVVSLMTSRRLSGRPIAVEYEQICDISKIHGAEPSSQQVTIDILCDDIVLNIFLHFLNSTPRFWPTLASVCKRWRQIVFTSPLGLNLRLHCTHGTPVSKALDYWPAFPIVVLYGGVPNIDPPAPEDDDNIIAALKESHRVSSISLTVTCSLVEKLSAISEPFSELEDLTLLSRDNIRRPVALPGTFRWGPRLRALHSTRIAFPSFPQLLLPSQGLVDLQLQEIPVVGYFPPEALTDALSGMTQLRSLSLHFLSLPPRRKFLTLPPQPEERALLTALTRLKYRGTSKYLDSLVARIDAPLLGDIDITFFSQPTMDASQLGRFIERIEMSPNHAEVDTSTHAISISFTNSSTSTPLRLQISCMPLDWQLSCMAQVCDQFSPILFRVEELRINTTRSSSGQNEVAGEQWLELVRSFSGARDIRMADDLTTDILRALGPVDGEHANVSPALRRLREENPMTMDEPPLDAAPSPISPGTVSGSPVFEMRPQCNLCYATFEQQQELKRHLEDQHPYRRMCLYCDDFECKSRQKYLFLKHLKDTHIEVVRNDALISNPVIYAPELRQIVDQHTYLREPGITHPTSPPPAHGGFRPDTDTKAPWAYDSDRQQPRPPIPLL